VVLLVAAQVACALPRKGPSLIDLYCVAVQVRQDLGCWREWAPALDPAYSKILLSKMSSLPGPPG
jgi:hypothetical protein